MHDRTPLTIAVCGSPSLPQAKAEAYGRCCAGVPGTPTDKPTGSPIASKGPPTDKPTVSPTKSPVVSDKPTQSPSRLGCTVKTCNELGLSKTKADPTLCVTSFAGPLRVSPAGKLSQCIGGASGAGGAVAYAAAEVRKRFWDTARVCMTGLH